MILSAEELIDILPNPVEIKKQLDLYIIGQDEAKKMLALLLLNRAILKLKRAGKIDFESDVQKSNVMLIGPTGTGKTALIKALSEIADIPISISDVTSITKAGYIGGKIEDILVDYVNYSADYLTSSYEELAKEMSVEPLPPESLITKYDFILEGIETGVIYLDEIDKIRSVRGGGESGGDAVQSELLKMLESGIIHLESSRKAFPKCGVRDVRTDDILFIVGGAFSGLEDIIYNRVNKSSGIGFLAGSKRTIENKELLLNQVTTEDLIEYGFKPEFLGRVPLRAGLNPLTKETLCRIIKEPKGNIVNYYTDLFKLFGVELIIEEEAINSIAEKAVELKMGARSIRLLFNLVLMDEVYNAFSIDKKLTITKSEVESRCG